MAAFRTSLPIRMDIEAMLAYLLLPPAGGVFLLLAEHDSDYVRFHAWQSSMLFTALFVSPGLRPRIVVSDMVQIIHLLLAWSTVLSWILFVCDVGLIGFLSLQAYRDGKRYRSNRNQIGKTVFSQLSVHTLEHYEIPFFGRLANSFVDNE